LPTCPKCHSVWLIQRKGNVFYCRDCQSTFVLVENPKLKRCGENVKIYPTAKIVNPENLEVGNNVTIGDFCFINAGEQTVIGDNSQLNAYASVIGGGKTIIKNDVCISYYATIISGTDTPAGKYMVDARPTTERKIVRGKITLEPNVFIGAHATITVSSKSPEITIGQNTVIGAGAYIDRSIPENTIVIPKQKLQFKKRTL